MTQLAPRHSDDPRRLSPIGEYLRKVMPDYGCSNWAELVRFLGVVDQSNLSRWADGSREPTLANLRKVADRLGITLPEILVKAGLCTEDEFTAPSKRRFAPALVAVQDFLDRLTPTSKSKEEKLQQFLLHSIRHLLGMAIEWHDGILHEPSAAERRPRKRTTK